MITESWQIYTVDNGANQGWGGWPVNEGTAEVTNQYDSAEPGSFQVNNLDGLHLVSEGYYGGHPNPLRANPDGAGLYTDNDQGLAVWRQQGGTGQHDLPANWLPVPPSLANPVEGDFQMPGVANEALYTWDGLSVNGLSEYTSLAFLGQMQGDLLTVAYEGNNMFRIERSADGTQVLDVEQIASNFANLPVDVAAQGDSGPFPGTIWVASLDGSITVFTPAEGTGSEGDLDGDGYTNEDELLNGTNPENAADKPADNDGDFVSDLSDTDDDNDTLADISDHFAIDAANGTDTVITSTQGLFYPMFGTEPGTGFFGLGFTGLMTNGATDYLDQYNADNLIPGGATGTFSVVNTSTGTAEGATNTQENGFQLGVAVDPLVDTLRINTRVLNPFKGQTPEDGQSAGFFIGTGDQDNYLKIAVAANGGSGGIEVVYEEAGTVVSEQTYDAAFLGSDFVDLFLDIDTNAGAVTPSWEYTSGGVASNGSGSTVTLDPNGSVLDALNGTYTNNGIASGSAVGVISTHAGASTPIEASYDHIAINPITTPSQTTVATVFETEGEPLRFDATDSVVYRGKGFEVFRGVGPDPDQFPSDVVAFAMAQGRGGKPDGGPGGPNPPVGDFGVDSGSELGGDSILASTDMPMLGQEPGPETLFV